MCIGSARSANEQENVHRCDVREQRGRHDRVVCGGLVWQAETEWLDDPRTPMPAARVRRTPRVRYTFDEAHAYARRSISPAQAGPADCVERRR